MRCRPLLTISLLGLLASGSAVAGPRILDDDPRAVSPSGDVIARAKETLTVRDAEAARVSLVHRETVALKSGDVAVRFSQQHLGVPVLGRGATAVMRANGQPTHLATAHLVSADDLPPSVTPSLTPDAAAIIAAQAVRAPFSAGGARLIILPFEDGARLVWGFYVGAVGRRAPFVAIDAEDGSIVALRDLAVHDRQAQINVPNPVVSPTRTAVTLDLPAGSTFLTSPHAQAFSCVDNDRVANLGGGFTEHVCDFVQKAGADANGDFPQVMTTDTDPHDPGAEVSSFFHATRAYTFESGLGMPDLNALPLPVLSNFEAAGGDIEVPSTASDPLQPYDNAFFVPADPGIEQIFNLKGGALFIGQGQNIDYAYDGDVLYHEFTHAMVDRTAGLVSTWHFDTTGALPSPGAMNEGLADFFSCSLAGDSVVGEYAVKDQPGPGGEMSGIRDIDAFNACPQDLVGETHQDSLTFSSALWQYRKTLSEADAATLEGAIITALIAAPSGDLGFDDLITLIQKSIAGTSLGQAGADALGATFANHGHVAGGCSRVIEYTGVPLSGTDADWGFGFTAPSFQDVNLSHSAAFVPGLFQVHLPLVANAVSIATSVQGFDLTVQEGQQAMGQPYAPFVVVRFGGPIAFTKGKPGAKDYVQTDLSSGFASTPVPAGATDAYVMIVNKGDDEGLYTQLELDQITGTIETGGSGGAPNVAGAGGATQVGGATQAGGSPTVGGSGGATTFLGGAAGHVAGGIAAIAGAGGSPITGAAGTGGAAALGETARVPVTNGPAKDGGCSCRTSGEERDEDDRSAAVALGALGLGLVVRRRKAR